VAVVDSRAAKDVVGISILIELSRKELVIADFAGKQFAVVDFKEAIAPLVMMTEQISRQRRSVTIIFMFTVLIRLKAPHSNVQVLPLYEIKIIKSWAVASHIKSEFLRFFNLDSCGFYSGSYLQSQVRSRLDDDVANIKDMKASDLD
jgi:hypothetical protein